MKKIVVAAVLSLGIGYLLGWARESYLWSKALADHALDQKNLHDFGQFQENRRKVNYATKRGVK